MNMTNEEIVREIVWDYKQAAKPAEAAGDEPRPYAEATGKALDVEAVRGAALEVIRELIEQDTDADVIYDRIIGVIVLEKKLEAQHGHV